jgi:hypothetical protein
LTLGRAKTCDIVLAESAVSKRHAELTFDRDSVHWKIKDLGSANGTEIEGEALAGARRYKLHRSGTELLFGTTVGLTYIEKSDLLHMLRTIGHAAVEAAEKVVVVAPGVGGFADVAAAPPKAEADTEPAPADPELKLSDQASQEDIYRYVPKPEDANVTFAADADGGRLTAPRAPTRRIRRPRRTPEFPLVKRDAARALLTTKLTPHMEAGAKIRIVFKDGGTGLARSLENALDILLVNGKNVLRVAAELDGEVTVVFSRPS